MSMIVPSLQFCIERAMWGRWSAFNLQFICFMVLILCSRLPGTSSLNLEGSILLKVRASIKSDPFSSLASWDFNDPHPCNWFGVHCVDGKVQKLDLSGLSLGGTLSPELGNLGSLRSIILHANHLSGAIPTEFGHLTLLEVLDLRDNNLTGIIPAEIGKLVSLKRLLLSNNKFTGVIPPEIVELTSLSELQYDDYLVSSNNKKIDIWPSGVTDSLYGPQDSPSSNLESSYGANLLQKAHNLASSRRRRLAEQSSNLEAIPDKDLNPGAQVNSQPISRSSGSFPASGIETSPFIASPSAPPDSNSQPVAQQGQPTSHSDKGKPSQKVWVYVAVALGVAFLLVFAAALFFMWRSRCAKPIGPFKTGISGQLQKAFVTGVPKLNRPELTVACEDFSNIIATFDAFTIYKGTLSSGVEIAVASTNISSSLDWSEAEELAYRKKIETLSKVNHKNFVNLLGYCEEQEPFTRMMVFEYAPSGNLFEHLHVEEFENLDWNSRIRIIMGAAYCLQYMHHDIYPPIAHSKLDSAAIYLTDDYAAKLAERPFEVLPKSKDSGEEGPPAEATSKADPRENVYDFGILLLEIITGRLPYSEEEGSLIDWASQYLNDKENNKDMIDPVLKSVKTNELEIICDVIQRCIDPNPAHRPTIQALTSRLREVITIAPDAAVPRLSPLWWAELEILSVEAT
ncbi:protein MALE DISCOVERER 1-like [Silene latifolia]|uniref:protein MALE DISCOVERER 1-like n=1 Tax=Silene latifolia TaxID=37657 RepID=UPI003D777204